jgi:peptidyl-prolyl cis-trans isomerase SurA
MSTPKVMRTALVTLSHAATLAAVGSLVMTATASPRAIAAQFDNEANPVVTMTPPALKPTTTEQTPPPQQQQPAAQTPKAKAPTASKKPAAKPTAAAPEKTASRGPAPASANEQAIVALVNDEPITGFELQQRAVMLSGGNVQQKAQENFKAMLKNPRTTERLKAILGETIKANQGKSKDEVIAIFDQRKKQFAMDMQRQAVESAKASALPGMKKQALDELIDEKIKLQEAKRLGVTISDDEINRVLGSIAERNKMSEAQFLQQLGGGVDAMKGRIRSTLSWNDVIRRRFGAQIAIASKDVEKIVAASTTAGQDDVELRVQRIRVAMPVKMDQAGVAQRMQDAEKIRAKFTDCKTTGQIAAGVAGAKFEELGKRRPSIFQEPTRTLLLNAKDGEMLPPSMGENGVELWVVCSRDVVKAEDQKRTQVEGELKQKEFELLAKRHMKDLRQDAHIEYR